MDKIAQNIVLGKEASDAAREFTSVEGYFVLVITSSDVIINRHCSTLTLLFANSGLTHT